MEGSLSKWTNVVNGWQYRWFVLDDNAGLLSYYTSKEKMMRGARRGCVRLRGAVIGIDDEDDSTFTITTSSSKDDPKTFHFQTRNSDERERWVRALEDTILRHSHTNTAIPVNGIYKGPSNINDTCIFTTSAHAGEPESVVQIGIELGSECLEPRASNLPNARNLMVPDFSYSSSDEDEDYYDATEDISTMSSSQHHFQSSDHGAKANLPTLREISSHQDPRRQQGNPPIKVDGSLDYDALYEEESEPEMDSMESHGSVVTHLLSQVKIGMDLTKVALPTFILERRSLLEMYADYFAHPDHFLRIADLPTPKERMIQVVRWYLCSFHAGRKSGVAKKPYNPILGEIFRCYWDVEEASSNSKSDTAKPSVDDSINDGPVPWCRNDQLYFIAEQVSHHPPVSAFYAEHRAKKICFNAHVWTKSRFLGLSIGVHNIGKGWINLPEHGEEYVLTFPNGYGRSILTVPWIELGGTTTITCAQTGYQATIEFQTKPFYGGKRNRIACQITQPGEKKPFLMINGEWSGILEAKYNDGQTDMFADVTHIPVVKKMVKPICEQDDNESRKVWRDVTVGLKINDMDKATAAKCFIEQKQRDEARIRKESNLLWKTKYFKETKDGGWMYIKPLTQ
ncbi:oxysterol-binding protein-related protein 9 isoform X6 [Microplitis mediator]|uniref:oxysterol-binding protein-related protein 9 isoform X6 n=1 Tax=Microplitis mediator TaxID=375433 RepID=UPI002553AFED|nr:oxysterol-binding protein-related protein 9 isoform X6 [Microplitis mediator]